MLRELHIKNIAVIEEVTVAFDEGFHVLTGETGAGKSILIDSINMALGERTDRELIRSGAESATVDVVFEPSSEVVNQLKDLGIEMEEDLLYISRQITVDGKSRCRINGSLTPLGVLREIAPCLLTIHGQHDNQSILSAKSHLGFVDGYGDYQDLIADYREQYHKVEEIKEKLQKMVIDEEERERRISLLQYQVQELENAKLIPGEEEDLLERRDYLAHHELILENCEKAYLGLYGDENGKSVYDLLSEAGHSLEQIHHLDDPLDSFYQSIHSVLAEVEDTTHEIKSYLQHIDVEPGELDCLEERLQLISSMKRKYGGSVEEALNYLCNAKEELSQMEDSDALAEELTRNLAEEEEVLSHLSDRLSQKRKETAISLQTNVMQELADLDMQKMRFSVSVELLETYTRAGRDRVEFLISGNPGESLKPLTKIASGGEMSRIMLALKTVLADGDPVETLIFDEIDTGVSGRAAQKIAEKMYKLAKNRQILCITHLAQIAAMADIHFLIEKHSDAERTHTTVVSLEETGRKEELARITGGVKITDLTLQAAQEMLDMATATKERC